MRAAILCGLVSLPLVSMSCRSDGDSTGPSVSPRHVGVPPGQSADALPSTALACGAQITSDVRLDNDLSCAGNALLVSGNDIRIDLNGHTLSGNGSGNGITVSASHRVTIFGGSVKGFQSGIFVGSSTQVVVRDNEFTATNQAVLLQATTGSIIKHNTVTKNLARAFMVRPNLVGGLSTNNTIISNDVSDTPTGIFLIRQPGNTIQHNTISGSSIAGIDLGEGTGVVSGTVVRANLLTGGGAGIRFSPGWTGNTFVGNRIAANDCGTQGPTAGNTLNGNVFSANGEDTCP